MHSNSWPFEALQCVIQHISLPTGFLGKTYIAKKHLNGFETPSPPDKLRIYIFTRASLDDGQCRHFYAP